MKSSSRSTPALALLCAGASLAMHEPTCVAAPQVEEQTLLADTSSATLNISPRGVHVAAVIPKGSRQAVVYDGVEGPRFDQVHSQLTEFAFTGNGGRAEPRTYVTPGSTGIIGGGGGNRQVTFNSDGTHWAYVGRIGDELVLMLDGKEIHRGPYKMVSWMGFSPGGTRLVVAALDLEGGQNCIIIDGKPGPFGADISEVFFTPDDAHYAYTGRQNDAQQTRWTVVDGRQVKFFGDLVGFLPNGSLLSRAVVNYDTVLLANGKPISQVNSIGHLSIAPVTGRLIMVVTPPLGTPPTRKPSVLTVDGQIIAGTEDVLINGAWFSPDGKRYALLCQRTSPRMETFMLVDGKRELSYQSIYSTAPFAPSFSPDSTQFTYVAMSANGQTFVVVNGEESDGVQVIHTPPVWSPTGSRLAWGGTTAAQKQMFFVDGKSVALPNNMQPGSAFRFSPDGKRTTWSYGGPNALTIIVDGAPLAGVAGTGFIGADAIDGTGTTVKFSPDGSHIALAAREPADFSKSGIWVDGRLITPTTLPQINRVTFTPDSQHVAWAVIGVKNNLGAYRIFVDGQEALTYASSPLDNMTRAWEMGADGVLTILAIDDGALKRFRITPGADASIATMVAAAGGASLAAPSTARTAPVSGSSTHAPDAAATTATAKSAAPPSGPTTASGKAVDPAAVENLNRINDERAKRGQPPLTAPGYTYVPADKRAPAPAATTSTTTVAASSAAGATGAKSSATMTPSPSSSVTPAAPARPLTYADLLRRPELWPAQCTMTQTIAFNAGATVKAGQKVKVDGLTAQEVELSTLDNKIQFAAAPDETDVLAVANKEYAALTPAQRDLTYATIARQKELWPYRLTIHQTFDLGRGQVIQPGDTAILVRFERGQPYMIAEKFPTSFTVVPQATNLMAQARQIVEAGDRAPSRVGTELEGKLVSSVTGQPTSIDPAASPRYFVFYRGSSTCSITRNFTPSLVKFYNEQRPKHPEFEIIYIMTETPENTGVFAREAGFAWPAVEYETTGRMPVSGEPFGSLLPQLVVMDRAGNVLANGVQGTAPAALQKLDALLNQPVVR